MLKGCLNYSDEKYSLDFIVIHNRVMSMQMYDHDAMSQRMQFMMIDCITPKVCHIQDDALELVLTYDSQQGWGNDYIGP